MSRALRIFRKDARRLWPQTLAFWSLLIAVAVSVPSYGFVSLTTAQGVLRLLEPLACWVLVICLIHEERLIGHNH